MSEIYSLASNFSNGLSNHKLKQIINDNNIITTNCADINTDNDIVDIIFDTAISGAERTELNNIISNYVYTQSEDYSTRTIILSISSKAMSANTDTLLDNWTVIKDSDFVDIDPVTGIFSPGYGNYSMIYQAFITTNAGATKIGSRLVNDLNDTVYSSTVVTDDLFSTETGHEGNQFENLTFPFFTGNTYTLHAKIDSNETMDFIIKICNNNI